MTDVFSSPPNFFLKLYRAVTRPQPGCNTGWIPWGPTSLGGLNGRTFCQEISLIPSKALGEPHDFGILKAWPFGHDRGFGQSGTLSQMERNFFGRGPLEKNGELIIHWRDCNVEVSTTQDLG